MSTSSNKRKRRRKTESFEHPSKTMSESSATNHGNREENSDCTGNKWKRRLHSLRRSLSKKKVTNFKEFEVNEEKEDTQECSNDSKSGEPVIADITFDNRSENLISNGWQRNYDENHSPLRNGCSSKDLDPPISSDDKVNVKKRKGIPRRTKGDPARGNKYHHSTSQQDLRNGKTKSFGLLGKQDSGAKQSRGHLNGRKNKSSSLFSSWFRLPRRSSSEKNLKHRDLSVSSGNFTEQESNFKLLRDVQLLRDPGYVSSSGDSLDLGEEKYHSLRRSRASLIDIRRHKHAKSEGNLANTTSRNLSPLSPPLTNATASRSREVLLSDNNTPKIRRDRAGKRRAENRISLPVKIDNCAEYASGTWEGWGRDLTDGSGVVQCSNSLGSFGNITEDDDVYLTAEEGSRGSSPNIYADSSDQPLPETGKEAESNEGTKIVENTEFAIESHFPRKPNGQSISLASLPVAHENGNLKQVTQANQVSGGALPKPKTLSESHILHVLPASRKDPDASVSRKHSTGSKPVTYVCKSCQPQPGSRKGIPKEFHRLSLGQLNELSDRTVVTMRCTQCKSPRLSKQNYDTSCHDVVVIRPPKKPAPKPPALMKNKSRSLTALAGKFPGLSEQLDVNESSSLHKLNDSCSDNLCELLSKSKDATSPASEGVYVGILGDQGVILRKRRVHQKQKRVVSMPSELLENVMEVEGIETANVSSPEDNITEISNEQAQSSQGSGNEAYLSCHSTAPSSVIINRSIEKELCMRSVSISSIDVQDVSMKKKIHSQSVPCLAFNKDCLDGLKATQSTQGILEDSGFSSQTFSISKDCISQQPSTAQSMMSLKFQEPHEDHDDTSDKVTGKPLLYAEALWDHVTMNEEELCFTAGQAIAVYDVDDPEWWFGLADDHIGWFPAAFVRIPVSGDLLNKYQNSYGRKLKNSDENSGSENGSDVCLSKEEIRAKIVEEIVSTEEDYVQNLKDIVEGYLKQAKKRPDMFNDKLLAIMFSNIEKIYFFHRDFLRSVERQYIEGSEEVGAVFMENREKFELYSEYCNNHPRASSELKHLLQQDKYRYFFEACRMLQDMIKISLDGFLLTPVQKICKYPLQLQELLKYTDPEHRDFENVKNALKTMREVASCINEKKRQVENIKKIAEWQLAIEQWEGEDVLVKSGQLVHSGEVVKLSKAGKAQDVTLFLFDHQLVYCRKDLIKKRSLEYKGRIVLENYKFEKLEDGEVTQHGLVVKNAWRLSSKQSNTTCLFQAKSPEQRDKWIGYFLQERKIVYETTSANSIPLEQRLAAMDEAKNAVKSRKQIIKGEKRYGNFNTVSRAIGQLHYGSETNRRKIDLPPPVSSAMLFQRDEARSSFGVFRNSGVFKKRLPKPRHRSQPK